MPFITEEIWQILGDRRDGESIMITPIPVAGKVKKSVLAEFETVKEIVSSVRMVRKEKNIPNRDSLRLLVNSEASRFSGFSTSIIKRLCNISEVEFTSSQVVGAASFMCGTTEFYIPVDGFIDTEAESEKLAKEIDYYTGFLNGVSAKLGNSSFVNNAPDRKSVV